jgi:hypothetical protein
MPETAPTPSLPPIDPKAIQKTFLAVLTKPVEFFPTVKAEQGYNSALMFSLVMGVIWGVVAAVGQIVFWPHSIIVAIVMLIVGVIAGALYTFVGGFILHFICQQLGSKAPFESSARISGYTAAILPLAAVGQLLAHVSYVLSQLVNLVVFLYGIYLVYLGAKALNFEPAAAPPAAPPAS